MRIEIQCVDVVRASGEVSIRAILFNDSFDPVPVLRSAFVGPNLSDRRPESVEPNVQGLKQPLILQPFSFYGRERVFSGFDVGPLSVAAYYRGVTGEEQLREQMSIDVIPD